MRHASFFSGIGGLDLGFERAGIETVSVSEIDPYANSVLAERFPHAPNLGSITEVNAHDIPEADIWSGGFPCQDLSTAGKRSGFAGTRSSLAFTFLDLVEQRRPRWLLLENVPGLFSSNKGADFGRLLYEMEQLGYGVSWRTLDARFFGVAQRRRRVFLVASLESDRSKEVLFECEGCERHPAPRRSQGQGSTTSVADGSGVASAVRASLAKRGERGDGQDTLVIGAIVAGLANRTGTTQDELYVGFGERVASPLTARFHKGVNTTLDEPLIVSSSADSDGVREADGLSGRMDNQPVVDTFGATTHRTLQARDWKVGVSNQDLNHMAANEGFLVGDVIAESDDVAMTLTAPSGGGRRDRIPMTVQGSILSFPSRFGSNANVTEGHAQSIAHSAGAPAILRVGASFDGLNQTVEPDGAHRTIRVGRDSSDFVVAPAGVEDDPLLPVGLDSHRYRCCGNGVVTPVAEWIGRRIVEVDRRWREEGE